MIIKSPLKRECAAECMGTFILMVFGLASVAQVVLSQAQSGNFLSINIGWGLAVMLGVYISGSISGAHLNPAITLALAAHNRFSWKKVAPYIGAQCVGALLASIVVYVTYYEAIAAFDGGIRQISGPQGTAGIFATYPKDFLSSFPGGFIDQLVGTGLLTIVVFALSDRRNQLVSPILCPIIVGATVLLIGMTFGLNAGYAINPARDFIPRAFTAVAGWGTGVFSQGNHWWWVPVTAPWLGAIGAGWLYDALFGTLENVSQAEA